jgi:hypothetical protein
VDTNEAFLPPLTDTQHDNVIGTQNSVITQILQEKTRVKYDN